MIRPPLFLNSRHEIVIETGGRLPLPAELVRPLGLEPGDIVALEPMVTVWKVRFYRQLLTFPWETAPGARWWLTAEFLRLPLTAIDETGALVIPPEVVPLSEGDRVVLRIGAPFGSSWPEVEAIEGGGALSRSAGEGRGGGAYDEIGPCGQKPGLLLAGGVGAQTAAIASSGSRYRMLGF